ncbi:MAG: Trm112 family protein [Alphaproteobacteria bacterium]
MSDPAGTGAASEQVDPRLLEVLVCPLTKATLQYDANAQELISRPAGLAYPIRNGVPLMVIEAAREIDDKPRTTDHP